MHFFLLSLQDFGKSHYLLLAIRGKQLKSQQKQKKKKKKPIFMKTGPKWKPANQLLHDFKLNPTKERGKLTL